MDKISPFEIRNPIQIIRGLGGRIRTHRLARGWTQAELAERSGISLSTLKLLEREGKGSIQRLAKVAVVLNLDGELQSLFAEPSHYASMEALRRADKGKARSRSTEP